MNHKLLRAVCSGPKESSNKLNLYVCTQGRVLSFNFCTVEAITCRTEQKIYRRSMKIKDGDRKRTEKWGKKTEDAKEIIKL